jgi:hypothetical protein
MLPTIAAMRRMRRYEVRFWNRLPLALVLVALAIPSARAQAVNKKIVTDEDLQRSLKVYEEYYGDVPSAVDCQNDQRYVVKLICSNKYLSDMELLYSRSQVYSIENAAKSEVDHKKYRGVIPIKCRSKECIYAYFKKHINDALGLESPFAE